MLLVNWGLWRKMRRNLQLYKSLDDVKGQFAESQHYFFFLRSMTEPYQINVWNFQVCNSGPSQSSCSYRRKFQQKIISVSCKHWVPSACHTKLLWKGVITCSMEISRLKIQQDLEGLQNESTPEIVDHLHVVILTQQQVLA